MKQRISVRGFRMVLKDINLQHEFMDINAHVYEKTIHIQTQYIRIITVGLLINAYSSVFKNVQK